MTRDTAAVSTTVAAAAPLVSTAGVTKTFGPAAGRGRGDACRVTALDDVTLEIRQNAFFTLLGPSGCGKTTLLRMLAGFEHPDAGNIHLERASILAAPPNRRPVNIVFQSYALFPHMSAVENVGFGLARQGMRGTALAERVEAMLRLVRLEAQATRRPAELSGGQQQRVALARALAPAPKLLLLDEPLSALDPKLRRGMQLELKRLQRETGITFLLVTHDQEALTMSDLIAVMDEGRIEQTGPPRDIYERPASRFVADFFGANVLPGALVGHAAPYAAVRPERVEVARAPAHGLQGRVAALAFHGAATAVTVALDGDASLVALRPDLPPGLGIGDAVACRAPATALVPLQR